MNLALINPKLWLEIAVVAALGFAGWYGYNWVFERGEDSVQRKWDSVEKERAEAVAKATTDALNATKDLQANAEKERGVKDAQIAALNRTNASLLVELSKRPSRPSGSGLSGDASNGAASKGCTGAGLYKEDGEVLARLARDADQLRISLKACYANYEAARAAINGTK